MIVFRLVFGLVVGLVVSLVVSRIGGTQPDAVTDIQHPQPRVGGADARQPGILQWYPHPQIELSPRQVSHLARAWFVGMRVLSGLDHGPDPDLITADPLHEGLQGHDTDEHRQRPRAWCMTLGQNQALPPWQYQGQDRDQHQGTKHPLDPLMAGAGLRLDGHGRQPG